MIAKYNEFLLFGFVFCFVIILESTFVSAASGSTQEEKKVTASAGLQMNQNKKDSQTEHSFEDLLIQGQFHFSDEAVTTVEEDKVLDSLIGVRTDFKDRLEKSADQF